MLPTFEHFQESFPPHFLQQNQLAQQEAGQFRRDNRFVKRLNKLPKERKKQVAVTPIKIMTLLVKEIWKTFPSRSLTFISYLLMAGIAVKLPVKKTMLQKISISFWPVSWGVEYLLAFVERARDAKHERLRGLPFLDRLILNLPLKFILPNRVQGTGQPTCWSGLRSGTGSGFLARPLYRWRRSGVVSS